jgi:hypothetical protein
MGVLVFQFNDKPICGEHVGYEKGDQLGLMIIGFKTD